MVLDREQEIAKEALKTGDKVGSRSYGTDCQRRALTALRQRKFQEQLLVKSDAQLQTLQELVSWLGPTQ